MSGIYTLYDYLPSGNGYKVRLVCRHLALNYRLVEMDIKAGATRTPEFLAKNPIGRIPLLELPEGGVIAESHAIISYLAEGSDLVPDERRERALMWQWMCFEQYNLEPNVGSARFWIASLRKTPQELGERYVRALADGNQALAVLENHLTDRRFLVADRFTLADIALYAYTHVAPEGGFPLDPYPAVRAWLARVAGQPRHSPISAP